MNTYPKCTETANSYQLWEEYVDPQGLMSEAEFNAMTAEARLQLIHDTFPNDCNCGG